MIVDCHAHFEPRILDLEALISLMNEAEVARTALIPLLTDPPETKKADFPLAVQRFMFYSSVLRPLGIAVTRSMYRQRGEWNMWFRKHTGEPQKFRIIQTPDNQSVADAIAKYPGRLLGWIFINPLDSDALDQLEKWRCVPGMIGVKIHPFWHQFPLEKVDKVAARAQELGLPLLVHLGFGPAGDYAWLVERFTKLKIIFAHLGIPYYKDIWRLAEKRANVFFDIASTYHVDRRLIRKAVKALGPQKILFGTDIPYAHKDALNMIKGWVEKTPLSDSEKELIFSGNFREIIDGN